mgnify:CR=1 FL=1
MNNARKFTDKLARGETCLGTAITLADPGICEALCPEYDFFWIDTEHTALSLEHLRGHFMAVKGSDAAALVRVPWNDPVLIKPVLDLGADGIIVPMVSTAEDVSRAVAACQYPPQGIRGFGPLRPLNYGRRDASQFCDEANESIIVVIQIEQVEAVENIEEILAVPGLTSIAFGPQDLAASFGYRTQPQHPEVLAAVKTVVEKAQQANIPVGISVGDDPDQLCQWADMGIQWLTMGTDATLLIRAAQDVSGKIRQHLQQQ